MNTRFIALWIKKMNLLIDAVLLKNINMQPHDISLHPDRVRKPVSILDDLLPSLFRSHTLHREIAGLTKNMSRKIGHTLVRDLLTPITAKPPLLIFPDIAIHRNTKNILPDHIKRLKKCRIKKLPATLPPLPISMRTHKFLYAEKLPDFGYNIFPFHIVSVYYSPEYAAPHRAKSSSYQQSHRPDTYRKNEQKRNSA